MALRSYVDGRLFGERWGAGAPRAVALHGWGRDRSDFAGVLEGLDALAVDLPGFGASPPPAQAAGAAWYARAAAALVEEIGAPQVVAGHSFGGRAAVVLAAQRPELVAGLVLVGAPLLRPAGRPARKPPLVYRLAKWGNKIGAVSSGRLEREKQRRGSADYRAASGVMRGVLVEAVNETYEDHLARLVCPVRLVWGSEDREVPIEVAFRAAELLAEPRPAPPSSIEVEVEGEGNGGVRGMVDVDVELDAVEGCGHMVLLEAPDRVRTALEGLLR